MRAMKNLYVTLSITLYSEVSYKWGYLKDIDFDEALIIETFETLGNGSFNSPWKKSGLVYV